MESPQCHPQGPVQVPAALSLFSPQHMTCLEKKVVPCLLLSAPWSLLCCCAQELQLWVPCRGGAVLPKLAGEGGQCPSAPGCPTLHDWLGFCGALMGFAVLGFQ